MTNSDQYTVDQFVPYAIAEQLLYLKMNKESLLTIIEGKDLFLGGEECFFEDQYEFPIFLQPMFVNNEKNPLYELNIPLWQEVFDWFESEHKLFANLIPIQTTKGKEFDGWSHYIMDMSTNSIHNKNKTYEEAFCKSKYDRRVTAVNHLINIVNSRLHGKQNTTLAENTSGVIEG